MADLAACNSAIVERYKHYQLLHLMAYRNDLASSTTIYFLYSIKYLRVLSGSE